MLKTLHSKAKQFVLLTQTRLGLRMYERLKEQYTPEKRIELLLGLLKPELFPASANFLDSEKFRTVFTTIEQLNTVLLKLTNLTKARVNVVNAIFIEESKMVGLRSFFISKDNFYLSPREEVERFSTLTRDYLAVVNNLSTGNAADSLNKQMLTQMTEYFLEFLEELLFIPIR